ncbi:MAG: hypothetical protein ACRDP7_23120 [Trebonia sp.]
MSQASTAGRRFRTPSAEVERGLLSAAEAVLVRDGPGALTVRAVAAVADIAPMGLYNRLGGNRRGDVASGGLLQHSVHNRRSL